MDDGRNVRFQKGVKSMKKMNLKNFFMKKKIAAGCIAAAALITAGSFGNGMAGLTGAGTAELHRSGSRADD